MRWRYSVAAGRKKKENGDRLWAISTRVKLLGD
jgi:hypothetical protein